MAHTEDYPVVDGYMFLPHYDKAKLESRTVDNFDFRGNDVIINGFPKSGNTWLLEVVKAMYNDWGLEMFEGAASVMLLEERTVYSSYFGKKRQRLLESIKCEDLPSPRLMRTNLPATLFPCHVLKDKGVKMIYISRNPKDIVVSTYYFWKSFLLGSCSTGEWEETVQSFLEDTQPFTPWVRHVGDWFQKGIEDNVLHVTYEDMKRDLPETVRKIADFLKRPLTEEDIDRVVRTTTVDAMRKNMFKMLVVDEDMVPKGENPFVRKGVVGDWKNHFTVAQSERFDSIIGAKVRSIDVNIPYQ